MSGSSNSNQPDRPLLLGLQRDPLAITLADPNSGLKYIAPLTPVAAESLAYALLSLPEVGITPSEAFRDAVREMAVEYAERDQKFLEDVGASAPGDEQHESHSIRASGRESA